MIRYLLIFIGAVLFHPFTQTEAGAVTCNFSMTSLNFGTVNLLSNGSIDTSAVLEVSCVNILTLSTNVRICPAIGMGSGGMDGTERVMLNGTKSLRYQIFKDAARTQIWGSTDVPALGLTLPVDILLLPLSSNVFRIPIYGRISAGQSAAGGGTYTSVFQTTQTRFTYDEFTLFAPGCSSVTANTTRVSFTVLASVARTCNVAAQNIDFGRHGLISRAINASGSLAVTCTSGLPFAIALNGGLSGGSVTQRKMLRGTSSIAYGLFTDSARTIPWGASTGQILSATGSGLVQNILVYGRVEPQSTPSPGIYTDTVVVTISY